MVRVEHTVEYSCSVHGGQEAERGKLGFQYHLEDTLPLT